MVLIALIGFVFVANAQQDKASVPCDRDNTVLVSVTSDSHDYTYIEFYNNSTKDLKVKVSILTRGGSEIGNDTFYVRAADEQGSSKKTPGKKIEKIVACKSPSTKSGCEVGSIKITKVECQ